MIICTLFLLAQLVLLFAWLLLWQRRSHQRSQSQKHLLAMADARSLCGSVTGSSLPAYAAPFTQLLYGGSIGGGAGGGSLVAGGKKPAKCGSPCSTLSSTLSVPRRTNTLGAAQLDSRFHDAVAPGASGRHFDLGIYGARN